MGSAKDDRKVALVFGASGISGWAVTRNLFSYPSSTTFSRIVGLTNRPLDLNSSQLPVDDPRLEIYSGINLRESLDTVKEQMAAKISKLDEVTHVYYCAYSNDTSYGHNVLKIRDINVHMTRNAVHAVDQTCSRLKFLVLQTGSNHYGVAVFEHLDKIDINPPLKESQPRIAPPLGDEIFYYGQVDLIKEAQKGFVPGITSMSFLEPIALFLSVWRYVHGPGAEIKFVGTSATYRHTNTDSSQDTIARSEIYLSVSAPAEADGEAFNTADYTVPNSWVDRWPAMVSYFGLKGTPPDEPAEAPFRFDEWMEQHQDDYERMCAEYGLRPRKLTPESWVFTFGVFSWLTRNRGLSLDKIRSVGFKDELRLGEGHFIGFDRMAAGRSISSKQSMQKGTEFEGTNPWNSRPGSVK